LFAISSAQASSPMPIAAIVALSEIRPACT
jgi:hypothetical protein